MGLVFAQWRTPALQSADQITWMDSQTTSINKPLSAPGMSVMQPRLRASLGLNPLNTMGMKAPAFIQTDGLTGRTDLDLSMRGEVRIRRADTLIKAQQLEYFQPTDQAKASGEVTLIKGSNLFKGSLLDLQLEAMNGYMLDPVFLFAKGNGQGNAQRIEFIDDKNTVASKVVYSSCKRNPGPDWLPDWFMKADQMAFSQDDNQATAKNAQLIFHGMPLLAAPQMSIPLNGERRSGFLAPTFFVDNLGGLEMSLPYYVNLAPNRDYTLTTTPMTQRGVMFSNEFRYLESLDPNKPFAGTAVFEFMPADELRKSSRWGMSVQHNGWADEKNALTFMMDINLVSDNNYWSDFTNVSNTSNNKLIQRVLSSTVTVAKAWGPTTAAVNLTQWQTQQGTDASTAIAPPFDKLPQLTLKYFEADKHGFDWSIDSDLTHFSVNRVFYCSFSQYASSSYCNQKNATRMVVNNQLSRPFVTSYGYFTPKLMINARQYEYDETYYGTYGTSAASSSTGVVVPTFSLDTGAVFERPVNWLNTRYTETLEPRAFYVYTPYKAQSDFPNYDTGSNDFNFATVFTENAYSGLDRIADAHTLTLGATSRLLNPETGAESARFGLAQRYRFAEQKVLLTPDASPVSTGYSDILGGANLSLTPQLAFETLLQYNYEEGRSERRSYALRYNPSGYRVINTAYRYQYQSSEVVDVSWQWPLNDLWKDVGIDNRQGQGMGGNRWYTVGRLNYSMMDERLVQSLLGFEYDAGCWVARVAAQRTQLTLNSSATSLMFQLELNDFSRVGFGSLGSVKDNVSRYQNLREPFRFAPSPFTNYE